MSATFRLPGQNRRKYKSKEGGRKMQEKEQSKKKKALRAAFPYTIPIMTGFLFLGFAYGFLMKKQGFSFLYPLFMSMTIFGGSLEFVTATMLLGTFAPLQTFLVALMIQMRHLFYGLAMLKPYRGLGKKKAYLIFALCDETFSINCTAKIQLRLLRDHFLRTS